MQVTMEMKDGEEGKDRKDISEMLSITVFLRVEKKSSSVIFSVVVQGTIKQKIINISGI